MQDESTTENDQESKSSEQRNFKKTLIFAAALFLIPFIIATLMGVIANQLSPVKQKTKAALAAENSGNTNLPVCSATADISELLQYHERERSGG
jgi:cytochrome bd-type quinol oxidase subunit 1